MKSCSTTKAVFFECMMNRLITWGRTATPAPAPSPDQLLNLGRTHGSSSTPSHLAAGYSLLRVEVGGRLVDQVHVSRRAQAERDGHTLQLTTRQRRDCPAPPTQTRRSSAVGRVKEVLPLLE